MVSREDRRISKTQDDNSSIDSNTPAPDHNKEPKSALSVKNQK